MYIAQRNGKVATAQRSLVKRYLSSTTMYIFYIVLGVLGVQVVHIIPFVHTVCISTDPKKIISAVFSKKNRIVCM